jgi:DHA2 family multidrug resistance protein-like MFS transporter
MGRAGGAGPADPALHRRVRDAAGAATPERGPRGEQRAAEAFTGGLREVAGISAVLLAGVAILAVTLLRHVRPIGEAEPEGAPEAVSAPDHTPERTPVAASA